MSWASPRDPRTMNPLAPTASTTSASSLTSTGSHGTAGEPLSCKVKCMRFLVGAIHVIDVMLGLTLLVYGGLVAVTDAMKSGMTPYFLSFGSILCLSAGLAFGGFRTPTCKRCGLYLGAFLAVPIAALYLIAGFYIMFEKDTWMTYMRNNASHLYLNESMITALGNAAPGMFIFGVVMGFLECCRFYMLLRIRKNLLKRDEQIRHASERGANPNTEPLLSRGIGSNILEDKSDSSGDFLPIEEESLHSDPLWWAKSKRTESGDLSWAKEPNV